MYILSYTLPIQYALCHLQCQFIVILSYTLPIHYALCHLQCQLILILSYTWHYAINWNQMNILQCMGIVVDVVTWMEMVFRINLTECTVNGQFIWHCTATGRCIWHRTMKLSCIWHCTVNGRCTWHHIVYRRCIWHSLYKTLYSEW